MTQWRPTSFGNGGFGYAPLTIGDLVKSVLQRTPTPTAEDVAQVLRLVPAPQRRDVAQAFVAAGVPLMIAQSGVQISANQTATTVKNYLTVAAAALAAFHGVRRNDSIFWGGWWFLMGINFPLFTSAVAIAQGLGKRK